MKTLFEVGVVVAVVLVAVLALLKGAKRTNGDHPDEQTTRGGTSDWWCNGPDLSEEFWRANPTDPLKLSEIVRWNNITARHEWVTRDQVVPVVPGPTSQSAFREGIVNRGRREAA